MSGSASEVLSLCGDVVAIELVKLPPHYDDDPKALASGFGGQVLARISDLEVGQVVARLRALALAEQKRCHLPVYSLRLLETDGRALEIALCFKCNNARTRLDEVAGWFTASAVTATLRNGGTVVKSNGDASAVIADPEGRRVELTSAAETTAATPA